MWITRPVATCRACYTGVMQPHDLSRPAPSGPDFEYSLTVEQCADQYALAGHPRTPRTIQRYCTNGALEARKVTTLTGDKYLVMPHSLFRHIEEITQLAAQSTNMGQPWTSYDSLVRRDRFRTRQEPTHPVAPRRDSERQETPAVATSPDTARRAPENGTTEPDDSTRQPATGDARQPQATHDSGADTVRHPATQERPPEHVPSRPAATDRDVAGSTALQLERENDFLKRQIEAKDGQLAIKDKQIAAKDDQIAALIERDRETNILMQSLQHILRPLLPSLGEGFRREPRPGDDARPS